MVKDNWKDTLYIWDGIVALGIPEGKGTQDTPVTLQWEGQWVPVTDVPDAVDAAAPKRNAFKKDIDADCKFLVRGSASRLGLRLHTNGEDDSKVNSKGESDGVKEKGATDNNNDDDVFYVAKLTEGEGWEMEEGGEKSRYHDTTHDVWVKSLKWSGNQKDETESLVVAKGTNDFGPFVSVGWIRPGCRWTVARRYLSEKDPRKKMPLREFYQNVVAESISVTEESGVKSLLVPPWQIAAMHTNHQKGAQDAVGRGSGRKRKNRTTV